MATRWYNLLVILLAGVYVLKAKASSVRGAFLGIYRGNDMAYICFKIPQPSTSPKWMGGGDRRESKSPKCWSLLKLAGKWGEGGAGRGDPWGFIMSSTFFLSTGKPAQFKVKKKKNSENSPGKVFVLFNSNGFIQRTCFFITHFVWTYFWLSTYLMQKWVRHSLWPPEAYHLVGKERPAFVKRSLILILKLILVLILILRAKSTICKTAKSYHKKIRDREPSTLVQ